jgi:hypothetical protein
MVSGIERTARNRPDISLYPRMIDLNSLEAFDSVVAGPLALAVCI